MSKTLVGPRNMMYEWLTCLLRVLLLMWISCLMCFIDSISLRSHRSLNLIIVVSQSLVACCPVTWVDVGGGCYRVVLEHGSPLRLDGLCVGNAHMSIACVSLTLVYLLQWLDVDQGCSMVIMDSLILIS